ERVADALRAWPEREPVWVVGASLLGARELCHQVAAGAPRLGLHPTTLDLLSLRLGARVLAEAGSVPLAASALVAVAARVLARLGRAGGLGRFAKVADRPGLASALAATWQELRLAGVDGSHLAEVDGDLAR